jgi:hypothetical protein
MTAFTDLSNVANAITLSTAQHKSFWMDNRVQGAAAATPVQGYMHSLWRYNKSNGANGAIASTGRNPTRSTLGALGQSNPTSGKQLFLLGMEHIGFQQGSFLLYDRLYEIGGLSGTVTTAQTVSATLTRNTSGVDANGVGNEIWLEIYSPIGTTATTITASYTNQAGTSGRTTQAATFGGTNYREETRLIKLALQDGDTGVQAVASVTLAVSTGTAGNFGVTIAKPISRGYLEGQGCATIRDFIGGLPSVPAIDTDACLALAYYYGSTTPTRGDFCFHFAEN